MLEDASVLVWDQEHDPAVVDNEDLSPRKGNPSPQPQTRWACDAVDPNRRSTLDSSADDTFASVSRRSTCWTRGRFSSPKRWSGGIVLASAPIGAGNHD